MAIIKSDSTEVKASIPPAFTERCAVRIQEVKFGPNSKSNPMITLDKIELCGVFDANNNLIQEIVKGTTTYKVAGLNVDRENFTLTSKAVGFYETFWKAAHPGEEYPGVDDSNPDIGWIKGFVGQAIIIGRVKQMRKQLTDEEKIALVAAGKPAEGALLTDEHGKPVEFPSLKISRWMGPYKGEVAPF